MSARPARLNGAHTRAPVSPGWVPDSFRVVAQGIWVGGPGTWVALFNRHALCVVKPNLGVLRRVPVNPSRVRLGRARAASIIKINVAVKDAISATIGASDAADPLGRTFEDRLTVCIIWVWVGLIDDLAFCIAADQPVHVRLLRAKPLNPRSMRAGGIQPINVRLGRVAGVSPNCSAQDRRSNAAGEVIRAGGASLERVRITV